MTVSDGSKWIKGPHGKIQMRPGDTKPPSMTYSGGNIIHSCDECRCWYWCAMLFRHPVPCVDNYDHYLLDGCMVQPMPDYWFPCYEFIPGSWYVWRGDHTRCTPSGRNSCGIQHGGVVRACPTQHTQVTLPAFGTYGATVTYNGYDFCTDTWKAGGPCGAWEVRTKCLITFQAGFTQTQTEGSQTPSFGAFTVPLVATSKYYKRFYTDDQTTSVYYKLNPINTNSEPGWAMDCKNKQCFSSEASERYSYYPGSSILLFYTEGRFRGFSLHCGGWGYWNNYNSEIYPGEGLLRFRSNRPPNELICADVAGEGYMDYSCGTHGVTPPDAIPS